MKTTVSADITSYQQPMKKEIKHTSITDDEHVGDKLLSNQGLLISIYWKLIGCGLVTRQPLAGNC